MLLEDCRDMCEVMRELTQHCSAEGDIEIAMRLARMASNECLVAEHMGRECIVQSVKAQRVDLIRMLQSVGICAPWPHTPTTLIETAALGDVATGRWLLDKALQHNLSQKHREAAVPGATDFLLLHETLQRDLCQALAVSISLDQSTFASWLLKNAGELPVFYLASFIHDAEWPNPMCSAVAIKSSWALDLLLSAAMARHSSFEAGIALLLLDEHDREQQKTEGVFAAGVARGSRRHHPVDVAIDNGHFHHLFHLSAQNARVAWRKRVLPSLRVSVSGSKSRERASLAFVREWLAAQPGALNDEYACRSENWKPLDYAVECGTWQIVRLLMRSGGKMTVKHSVSIRSHIQDEADVVRASLLERVLLTPCVCVVLDYLESAIEMFFFRKIEKSDRSLLLFYLRKRLSHEKDRKSTVWFFLGTSVSPKAWKQQRFFFFSLSFAHVRFCEHTMLGEADAQSRKAQESTILGCKEKAEKSHRES